MNSVLSDLPKTNGDNSSAKFSVVINSLLQKENGLSCLYNFFACVCGVVVESHLNLQYTNVS